MGHATLNVFKHDLEKTRLQIVSEQPYSLTEPSIDAQINAMKASGAYTVLLITTQKMTVMALQKIRRKQSERKQEMPLLPRKT